MSLFRPLHQSFRLIRIKDSRGNENWFIWFMTEPTGSDESSESINWRQYLQQVDTCWLLWELYATVKRPIRSTILCFTHVGNGKSTQNFKSDNLKGRDLLGVLGVDREIIILKGILRRMRIGVNWLRRRSSGGFFNIRCPYKSMISWPIQHLSGPQKGLSSMGLVGPCVST